MGESKISPYELQSSALVDVLVALYDEKCRRLRRVLSMSEIHTAGFWSVMSKQSHPAVVFQHHETLRLKNRTT